MDGFCPIETPEGPNIGLINTLSTYAKIDEFGFLQSPYHPVSNGVVDKNPKNVKYLNAFEEERFRIAQANTEIEKSSGKLSEELPADTEIRLVSTILQKLTTWMFLPNRLFLLLLD